MFHIEQARASLEALLHANVPKGRARVLATGGQTVTVESDCDICSRDAADTVRDLIDNLRMPASLTEDTATRFSVTWWDSVD